MYLLSTWYQSVLIHSHVFNEAALVEVRTSFFVLSKKRSASTESSRSSHWRFTFVIKVSRIRLQIVMKTVDKEVLV